MHLSLALSPGSSVLRRVGGVLRPSNVVVAAIGDSLMAQSVGTTVGGFVQQDFRGALPWARALAQQRCYLPGGAIKGVGGNRLDQILARITDVTSMSIAGPDGVSVLPGTVVLNGGANDIGQSADLATVISRLESCISAIRAAGQIVVLIGPTPQSSGTTWNATQLGVLADFRDYCRARSQPAQGVLVADAWDDIASAPDGDVAAATMLRDTAHWHPKAAYLVGLRLKEQIDQLFTEPRPLAGTNLLLNPELAGTSGSKGGGITGNVASSWIANTAATLTGDQTITASKIDLGGGQYAQQFHVSGTWAGSGDVSINQTLPNWGTTYNTGDIMSFDGIVEVDGISPPPTGKHVPMVKIIYKGGSEVVDALLGAAEPTPAATPLVLNPRVERFTHGADSTRNTPVFVYGWPAGTYDFTLRFRAPKYVRH